MRVSKNTFANKMFEAYASTTKSRYIFLCNLDHNIARLSKNAVDFFGLPGEYIEDIIPVGSTYVHPDDKDMFVQKMKAVFDGKCKEVEIEYRAKGKEEDYVVCRSRGKVIKDEEGGATYFAGIIANHGIIDNVDPTTNLYNMYEFFNQMDFLAEQELKSNVLLVGFKHFSEINDVYGYRFGNDVMKNFASFLLDNAKTKGQVFRMDGSKFAICTTSMSAKELSDLYKFIQSYSQNMMKIQDFNINLSLCGSLVCVENLHVDSHSIYAAARYALEQSKNEKLGELVVVNDSQLSGNLKTIEVIAALRKSIQDNCNGFYMCYQPIVSSITGKLVGMEALLRWNSPKYGEVSPGLFIPWIETDSSFFQLGNWILKTALLDTKDLLQKYPDLLVHINLSYTQLERSEFLNAFVDILKETEFPPGNLCLELTERCRLLDIHFLKNEIIFLKSYGVKIALDDFGTGFSSLNLLRELPIDCIKIDQGFIKEIEKNVADQHIVNAITTCANGLLIDVCVEGIETKHLQNYMQRYRTTCYQGYYFSKPVTMNILKENIK